MFNNKNSEAVKTKPDRALSQREHNWQASAWWGIGRNPWSFQKQYRETQYLHTAPPFAYHHSFWRFNAITTSLWQTHLNHTSPITTSHHKFTQPFNKGREERIMAIARIAFGRDYWEAKRCLGARTDLGTELEKPEENWIGGLRKRRKRKEKEEWEIIIIKYYLIKDIFKTNSFPLLQTISNIEYQNVWLNVTRSRNQRRPWLQARNCSCFCWENSIWKHKFRWELEKLVKVKQKQKLWIIKVAASYVKH